VLLIVANINTMERHSNHIKEYLTCGFRESLLNWTFIARHVPVVRIRHTAEQEALWDNLID